MSVYNLESAVWGLRTAGGVALSKGFGAFGISVQGGARSINLEARRYDYRTKSLARMKLQMSLTGFEISIEKGKDLLEEFTGISISRIVCENDYTIPLVNQKNPTEMQTHEFTGPCSIVSFDIGKVSVGKELIKHSGATYLFLGQNTTIADTSPDWLQRVVDNSTSGTLGGNVYNFNKGSGPFSNARAATRIEINEVGMGAKVVGASIAMFSGQITVTGMEKFK